MLREPSGCFTLKENLYLLLKEKRAPGRRNDLGICPGLGGICTHTHFCASGGLLSIIARQGKQTRKHLTTCEDTIVEGKKESRGRIHGRQLI